MKRRDFLATSAAAAAGSGLVACRPPETSAAAPLTSGQWGSGDYSHVPGLAGPAHGTVWGRTGVTACSDYYASLAGTQTMMQGGNAIDAMVAACATLNVSDPYMSGIGGFGGYMLIYLAEENRVVGLDALGKSPAASSPETMTLDDFAMGYKAPIVPGAFKGWAAALERYGTMSLGDLFEPAIQLAEDGFVFSKFDERYTQSSADKLSRFPSTTRVFFPNGRPPRMGEIIRQPELAASMRHLARAGADDLYRGELADRIVAFLAENGGHLTKADLESYEVEWREPIRTTFQGYDLHAMPPGSCGMSMFQALNIMDGFDLANMDLYGSEFVHLWLEAMKLALADDDRYNTGKEDVDIPVDMIISREYADEQRAKIDPVRVCGLLRGPAPVLRDDESLHGRPLGERGRLHAVARERVRERRDRGGHRDLPQQRPHVRLRARGRTREPPRGRKARQGRDDAVHHDEGRRPVRGGRGAGRLHDPADGGTGHHEARGSGHGHAARDRLAAHVREPGRGADADPGGLRDLSRSGLPARGV